MFKEYVELTVAALTVTGGLLSIVALAIRWVFSRFRALESRLRRKQKQLAKRTSQLSALREKSRQLRDAALLLQQSAADSRETVDKLERDRDAANRRLEEELAKLGRAKDEEYGAELEAIKERWSDDVETLKDRSEQLELDLADKIDEGEEQLRQIQDLDAEVAEHEARIAKIVNREGRVWEPDVADDAPKFVPREDRRAMIVSVLNLKGGVGKTTLTPTLRQRSASTLTAKP